MGPIRTSRDLYLALADLGAKNGGHRRGLEEYLRALWGLTLAYRDRPHLSGDELVGLFARAFTEPAPPFDEAWRAGYERDFAPAFAPLAEFAAWEARVLRQVVDLHEMAERGALDDEQRSLGINSPRGSRWYNFDPTSYLECGAAGTFGGWEEGDGTGRAFVPGPVAVLGDDGRIAPADLRDLAQRTTPLCEVRWDDFRDFLGNGQWYE